MKSSRGSPASSVGFVAPLADGEFEHVLVLRACCCKRLAPPRDRVHRTAWCSGTRSCPPVSRTRAPAEIRSRSRTCTSLERDGCSRCHESLLHRTGGAFDNGYGEKLPEPRLFHFCDRCDLLLRTAISKSDALQLTAKPNTNTCSSGTCTQKNLTAKPNTNTCSSCT